MVRSLEHRNTLPTRGHTRPVESVMRSLSVPPSKISTLPKHDKEPLHFWGLAFPLDSSVLLPQTRDWSVYSGRTLTSWEAGPM